VCHAIFLRGLLCKNPVLYTRRLHVHEDKDYCYIKIINHVDRERNRKGHTFPVHTAVPFHPQKQATSGAGVHL
jgi:hypothetical protein